MLRASLLPVLLVAGLTGCETFKRGADGILRPTTASAFTLADEENSADDEVDEWAFVGNEARGNRMLEKDPDNWWKKFVMSPKANNIERNLGIAGPDE